MGSAFTDGAMKCEGCNDVLNTSLVQTIPQTHMQTSLPCNFQNDQAVSQTPCSALIPGEESVSNYEWFCNSLTAD